jgi:para-nitrobenzyl esterase
MALCACTALLAQTAPRVVLQDGMLEGTHFNPNPADAAFLGIPYAASPIGNLRWQPPQPPQPWSGIRQATAYGPACPQLPSGWLPEMLGRKQMVTDEACLYLNVWTTNLNSQSRLPVMVWIHGGGNVEGSQEWPPLGPTLATHGVVVVSINYRLGVFGFFAHPALTAESAHHASGNYGMLDQMQALRWVHQNIDKFGGDPDQITVFGASSGSLDICDLMASPLAAGLFQRAVLQSGFCVDSNASLLARAETRGQGLAKILGIANDSHALASLRTIPADKLLKTAAADPDEDFDPIVDDWVLPEQPPAIFAQGKQAHIPILLGSNADEVSIFASPIVGAKSHRPTTVAEYRQWLNRRFHARADEVFAAYPAHSDGEVPQTFVKMDSDFDFGFGAWLMARETQAIGQNAFLYYFTYVGHGQFAPLGAFHSEESILLSKKYWASWVSSPDDEKLSSIIIDYWTQFAKTANPAGSATPPWPPYDPATNRSQELGMNVGQIPVANTAGMKAFGDVMNDQR